MTTFDSPIQHPRNVVYVLSVGLLSGVALWVEPSVLHAFGWGLAVVATYFYARADELAREMLHELTHFDPTHRR